MVMAYNQFSTELVKPICDFASELIFGAVPLTVQFSDSSKGFINSWLWNFGDGQTSNEQNPSHTYNQSGTFTVSLKVTGPDGSDTETKENYINVQRFWADINGDGQVDIADIQLVATHWNTRIGDPDYDANCDVNNEGVGDGVINVIDIQLVAAWWNKPITSSATHPLAKGRTNPQGDLILRLVADGFDADGNQIVSIMVENAEDLAAFEFDFVYNQNAGQFVDAMLGNFLGVTGNSVSSLGPIVDNANGRVTFGAFSFGAQPGASGSGVLARMILENLSQTDLHVNLENVQLTDKQGNVITVSDILTSITGNGSGAEIPKHFSLGQNYPNPFNPVTSITYSIPDMGQSVRVLLSVYDLTGRSIKTLLDTERQAGYHTVIWDGTDEMGQIVSSGIYIYSITAGTYRSTRKMVFTK